MGNFYKNILQTHSGKPTSIVSPGSKPVTSSQAVVVLPTISWTGTLGTVTCPSQLVMTIEG